MSSADIGPSQMHIDTFCAIWKCRDYNDEKTGGLIFNFLTPSEVYCFSPLMFVSVLDNKGNC